MAQPSLDEIIAHYQEHGLLAHEEVIRDLAGKLRSIATEIPEDDLKRNIAFLTVWPLVEMYKLTARAITSDLKSAERDNIFRLNQKYHALVNRGEQAAVLDYANRPEKPRMRFINPYTHTFPAYTSWVQEMAAQCETWHDHLRDTGRSYIKALHDAQMGGTLLVIEKQQEGAQQHAPFTLYQRSFICVNENGEPVLFMDALQHHDGPDVSHLEQWRGFDRKGELVRDSSMHQVYASIAAAMYLAEKLDIRYLVLRDTPLVDFSREHGIRERRVFSSETLPWKIGLHSFKPKKGVHTNLLYGSGKDRRTGTQVRYQLLEQFPHQNSMAMVQLLETLTADIIESNSGRKNRSPKTQEKLYAANALYLLIDEFPLTPHARKQQAYQRLVDAFTTVDEPLFVPSPKA